MVLSPALETDRILSRRRVAPGSDVHDIYQISDQYDEDGAIRQILYLPHNKVIAVRRENAGSHASSALFSF